MAILRAVSPDRLKHAAVLEAVKVRPGNAGVAATAEWRPTLTASARVGVGSLRSGRKNARGAGRTKEGTQERKSQHRGNARFLIRGSSQDGQAWPLQPLPPSLRGFRPPFTRNDYSVPTTFGHRDVLVRGYVHDVVISCGAEVIARHPRS